MDRHLPLERGVNFRDFGGYDTADGARVKWRKLFRCGHLAKLSESDQATLESLQLGFVCDFRSERENEKLPPRLSAALMERRILLNIWPKSSRTVGDMMRRLAAGEITDDEIYHGQNVIYREFVTDFAAHYGLMFARLLQAEGQPILIHCTAGKDRTGLGAALILSALGVPEEVIVDDYLISNGCPILREEIFEIVRRSHELKAEEEPRFMRLLGARADSLHAAFAAISQTSGSMDGYLTDSLGVSAHDRDNLRRWYLES